VQEHQPITGQLLENEAFATKEARADALGEGDGDVDAARAAEKGVLLRDDLATPLLQVNRRRARACPR
jgi:hypothetical protein